MYKKRFQYTPMRYEDFIRAAAHYLTIAEGDPSLASALWLLKFHARVTFGMMRSRVERVQIRLGGWMLRRWPWLRDWV